MPCPLTSPSRIIVRSVLWPPRQSHNIVASWLGWNNVATLISHVFDLNNDRFDAHKSSNLTMRNGNVLVGSSFWPVLFTAMLKLAMGL